MALRGCDPRSGPRSTLWRGIVTVRARCAPVSRAGVPGGRASAAILRDRDPRLPLRGAMGPGRIWDSGGVRVVAGVRCSGDSCVMVAQGEIVASAVGRLAELE